MKLLTPLVGLFLVFASEATFDRWSKTSHIPFVRRGIDASLMTPEKDNNGGNKAAAKNVSSKGTKKGATEETNDEDALLGKLNHVFYRDVAEKITHPTKVDRKAFVAEMAGGLE